MVIGMEKVKMNLPTIKKAMTHRDLARRLGISESYLSLVINKKRKPSEKLAKKLEKLGWGSGSV